MEHEMETAIHGVMQGIIKFIVKTPSIPLNSPPIILPLIIPYNSPLWSLYSSYDSLSPTVLVDIGRIFQDWACCVEMVGLLTLLKREAFAC